MFHHLCLTWAFRGKCGCCVNTLTNNQSMVGYVYNTYKFLETKTYVSIMINVNNHLNGKLNLNFTSNPF